MIERPYCEVTRLKSRETFETNKLVPRGGIELRFKIFSLVLLVFVQVSLVGIGTIFTTGVRVWNYVVVHQFNHF